MYGNSVNWQLTPSILYFYEISDFSDICVSMNPLKIGPNADSQAPSQAFLPEWVWVGPENL